VLTNNRSSGHATAQSNVASIRCSFGLFEDCIERAAHEVKGGIGQGQRCTVEVTEHKDGRVERGCISPPPLPLWVVLEGSTEGTELVPPHDLGTDAVVHVSSEQVVNPATLGTTIAEGTTGRVRSPGEEFLRAEMSERLVETLIVASAVSIGGHGEALHLEQLGHVLVRRFVAGAATREECRAVSAMWRGGFTDASHHDATTGMTKGERSLRKQGPEGGR